ncbi:hypothetical protein Q1695_005648 [Nippostrongylus brasiliensis]|nr:hypothetical protein Q1695_005648 [Nippostrongylus brasiliensis]
MRYLLVSLLLIPISSGEEKCNPFYVRWPRVRLNFKSVASARLSLRACESACSLGEDPQTPGRSLECAALNHHPSPDGFAHHCDIFQPHQLQNVDGYVEADDRYSFYWKYCLNTSRKCGGEHAFTYLSDRYMDARDVTRVTKKGSLEECLVECLDEKGTPCRSISFNRTDGGCHISADSQLTKPQAIHLNNNPNFRIDYYENNCYNLSDTFKFEEECRKDGILVKVKSKFPYSGALYGLYDFFTCRIEPKGENEFEYLFPSPTTSRNCSDSIRFQGDEMVLDVVLSTDGIEPLYFITPDDLTYQAKCPLIDTKYNSGNGIEEEHQATRTSESISQPSNNVVGNDDPTENSGKSEAKAKVFKQTYPLPVQTTTNKPTERTEASDSSYKQVIQQIIRAHLEKRADDDEDLLHDSGQFLNENGDFFQAQQDPENSEVVKSQFQAPIVDFFATLSSSSADQPLTISVNKTTIPTPIKTTTTVPETTTATSPGNGVIISSEPALSSNIGIIAPVKEEVQKVQTVPPSPGATSTTETVDVFKNEESDESRTLTTLAPELTTKIDRKTTKPNQKAFTITPVIDGIPKIEELIRTAVAKKPRLNDGEHKASGVSSSFPLSEPHKSTRKVTAGVTLTTASTPIPTRTTGNIDASSKTTLIQEDATESSKTPKRPGVLRGIAGNLVIEESLKKENSAEVKPTGTPDPIVVTKFSAKPVQPSEGEILPSDQQLGKNIVVHDGSVLPKVQLRSGQDAAQQLKNIPKSGGPSGKPSGEESPKPTPPPLPAQMSGKPSGKEPTTTTPSPPLVKASGTSSGKRTIETTPAPIVKVSGTTSGKASENPKPTPPPAISHGEQEAKLPKKSPFGKGNLSKEEKKKKQNKKEEHLKVPKGQKSAQSGAKSKLHEGEVAKNSSSSRGKNEVEKVKSGPKKSTETTTSVPTTRQEGKKERTTPLPKKKGAAVLTASKPPTHILPKKMTEIVQVKLQVQQKPSTITHSSSPSPVKVDKKLDHPKGKEKKKRVKIPTKIAGKRVPKAKTPPKSRGVSRQLNKMSNFILRRNSLIIPIKIEGNFSAAIAVKGSAKSRESVPPAQKLSHRKPLPEASGKVFQESAKPKLSLHRTQTSGKESTKSKPLPSQIQTSVKKHEGRFIPVRKLLPPPKTEGAGTDQKRQPKNEKEEKKVLEGVKTKDIPRPANRKGKLMVENGVVRKVNESDPLDELIPLEGLGTNKLSERMLALLRELAASLKQKSKRQQLRKNRVRKTQRVIGRRSRKERVTTARRERVQRRRSKTTKTLAKLRQNLVNLKQNLPERVKGTRNLKLVLPKLNWEQVKVKPAKQGKEDKLKARKVPQARQSSPSSNNSASKSTKANKSLEQPSSKEKIPTIEPSKNTASGTNSPTNSSTSPLRFIRPRTTAPTTPSTTQKPTTTAPSVAHIANRSPPVSTIGPPGSEKTSSNPTKPAKGAVSFDIFHNGQPVEAVVVGTKITLSFAPLYAIPPEHMSVRECQVEPIDSKYEWEREPLPIIREGCQADLVGLVCPPTQSEFGVKVAVESFRYQSTPHVQYSCLVRICPFAPCPTTSCPPVEGCSTGKRVARGLSLEEIRRALEADPKLASQIGLPPHAFTSRPGNNVEQQLRALAGDHTVKRRLVVVNSEDQLRYYVRTGDIP